MQRGFTLVELAVVLAVLAVLAGVALPAAAGYRDRAAAGVNEVNLRATRRQIEMVRSVHPDQIEPFLRDEQQARQASFQLGEWTFSAPNALNVASGEDQVEAGTPMRARLVSGRVETSYWEIPGEVPPEMTLPPETEPTVPWHTCRDSDNCICDTPGCGKPCHQEEKWTQSGNCRKCRVHYIHHFGPGGVCLGCRLDAQTGQTHQCSFQEGQCRCRCGEHRCAHTLDGIGKCPICGNRNSDLYPCPNCQGMP